MKKQIREILTQIEKKENEARSFLEQNNIEGAKKARDEIRSLKDKLDIAKELDKDPETRDYMTPFHIPEKRDKKTQQEIECRAIMRYLGKAELSEEERTSLNIENGNALLPSTFYDDIQILRKGYPSLKTYCHVIPVKTISGKMPMSKGTTTKKLAKLQRDKALLQDMITTEPIDYAVEDYGKIIPIENSLIEDAGVDVLKALVEPALSEDAVNTENAEIMLIVKGQAEAKNQMITGTSHKDIIKVINEKIPPALKSQLIIITNQTGYSWLDGLEDKNGRPLLTELVDKSVEVFKGKPVIYFDNEEIPNTTIEATEYMPIYVVNLYALVKFFDRKKYEIGISKEAGFTTNQTLAKVIERFDLTPADTRACYQILIPKPTE